MIQPIAGILGLFRRRFPNFEELPLRKRFCLAYLQWKLSGKYADKEKFVDLAKEFRKELGRRGAHRTIIEKEARKFFREVRKHRGLEVSRQAAREYAKGQRDRGEGIHTPEEKELKKQRWAEVRKKQSETGNEPHAKVWVITDPNGVEFRIKNLTKWCRKKGFSSSGMSGTALESWAKKSCFGYRARHYDESRDSHVPWDEEFKPKEWD